MQESHHITCSLCEASCGAIAKIEKGVVIKVNPDPEDALSGGFICAKGAAIPELEADPDRLKAPLLRKSGKLQEVSWEEAFQFIDEGLTRIIETHGSQSVATYIGNALAHNYGMLSYISDLSQALASPNVFSAGTLDQMPRQVVSGLLYGSQYSIHVPDLDRAQLLWIIGANPAESNGSLIVAPGFLRRIQAIQAREGRIVVFDPRRTKTARRADEHVAVRPGSDAALLAAVAHQLLQGELPASRAIEFCQDIDSLKTLFARFTPDAVAQVCQVDAKTIERLATELSDTPRAAVYGRMGTTTQTFSSLVCWLIDVVNILAGNLDEIGGAMFPTPLFAQNNTLGDVKAGEGFRYGRWRSRVSGHPEVVGELPVACMAEEMETPGKGQIRALITVAGNPVISSPESHRLQAALEKLDLIISLDIYANETSSKADVILPSPSRLARPNYDSFLYKFAIRSYGRYTQAYRNLRASERSDREILLRLASIARGLGSDADIEALDDQMLRSEIESLVALPGSSIEGRSVDAIVHALSPRPPLDRRLDLNLRVGPFGDGFGAKPGISLQTLCEAPSGVDCGALAPRLPDMLRTKSGMIELKHKIFVDELDRLAAWLLEPAPDFVLVGRRQLRSNNSWFHNLPRLKHRARQCTLQLNDVDAKELGIEMGDSVTVSTNVAKIMVQAEVTSEIARGVVSLPHGWGHSSVADTLKVASENPGANVNEIIDFNCLDPLTGTARLNGMGVRIAKTSS